MSLPTYDANAAKGRTVVLHLGSVEMKDYSGKFKEMLERGEKGSSRYEKLVAELVRVREAKKGKFVERLYASLQKVIPEAEARGLLALVADLLETQPGDDRR